MWPSFYIQQALAAKTSSLPVRDDENTKEKDTLKQVQVLFCLTVRELVVSSDPISEPKTADWPLVMKVHLKKCVSVTLRANHLSVKSPQAQCPASCE